MAALWVGPVRMHAALRDDAQHRDWLQLDAPGLTIISDVSESKLRKWALEVELFRTALQIVLPLPPEWPEKPATLFLFSSDGAMRPFLPVIDGKTARVSAMFTERMGRNLGLVSFGGSRFETRERLYHELTHWHLHRVPVVPPLWFHEGVAQAMESFTLQGAGFRIGAPNEDLFTVIKSMRPIPLLPLLTKSELDYSAGSWKHGQTGLFNAEAAVLVNLLFFGAGTGNLSRFGPYLEAVQQGLPAEKAFVTGFGLSLPEAQRRLDLHVHAPRWNVLTIPLNRQRTDSHAWPVTPLAGEAVDRRLASVLISTGRIELAMTFLRPVLAAHPADVEALELKADALMSDNYVDPPPEAVTALIQAYRAGSRHPWICCLLGYVATGRALPELADATTGQPVTALEFFQQALTADPQFTPAYVGIAGLFLNRNTLTPAERGLLAKAQRLLPNSPTVLMALAHADLLDDKPAQARQRLEDYFQTQPDLPANVRLQLKQMSAELPEN